MATSRIDSYSQTVHLLQNRFFIPCSRVMGVHIFTEAAHLLASAVSTVAMGALGLISLTPFVSAKLGLNNHNFRKGCSDLFVLSIADIFRSAVCALPGGFLVARWMYKSSDKQATGAATSSETPTTAATQGQTDLSAKVETLQQQLDSLTIAKATLEKGLENELEQKRTLTTQVATTELLFRSEQQKNIELEGLHDKLKEQCGKLQKSIEDLTKQFSQETAKTQTQTAATIDALKAELKGKEEARAATQTQLEKSNAESTALQKSVEILNEEVKNKEEARVALEQKLSEATAQSTSLQKEVDALKAQIAEKDKDVASAQSEGQEVVAKNVGLQATITQQAATIATISGERDAARTETEDLRRQLADATAKAASETAQRPSSPTKQQKTQTARSRR